MNQPWVYRCQPNLNPPTHFRPHPIPLGCPSTPALSALLHALNLVWSILHMVIYIFQCYSLISSYPHLLPQSTKVHSLCLFCCLAYRVIVNCLSKFHIYVLIYCIGVSLSDLTSLCIIGSGFIHLIRIDSNAFFFPLCVCTTTSLAIRLPMGI